MHELPEITSSDRLAVSSLDSPGAVVHPASTSLVPSYGGSSNTAAPSALQAAKDQAKRASFKAQYDKRTAALAAAPKGPTFAELADDIKAAADADIAVVLLDQGRHLPAEQQAELRELYERTFPETVSDDDIPL